MDTYRVVNYFDVWYNDEEGYQVNNLCEEGTIELKDYTSTNEIIVKLQQIGFLNPSVTSRDIDVWNDYEFIELYVKETGEPIGRLELIH